MSRVIACRQQQGLTLIEVLIALSIFALLGVASYRMLNGVMAAQQTIEQHSQQLAQFQKAMTVIDRDMQFLIDRPVRIESKSLASIVLNKDYPVELTRIGWRNPLMLARSQLQRVAYDIGLHPLRDQQGSVFYGSNSPYLRRIYWSVLDRTDITEPTHTQALLAGVESLEVYVISEDDKGDRQRDSEWPLPVKSPEEKPSERIIVAIEVHLKHRDFGDITRLYRVN